MEKTQEVTTAARHGAVLLVTTLPGHSPVGTEPRVAHRRPPNTTAPTTWWKLHRDRPRGREGHRDPEAGPPLCSPACAGVPVVAAEAVAGGSVKQVDRPPLQCLHCGLWKRSLPPPAARGGAKALCTCCTEGGARSFLQTRWRPQRTLAPPCNFPAPLGADRRAW